MAVIFVAACGTASGCCCTGAVSGGSELNGFFFFTIGILDHRTPHPYARASDWTLTHLARHHTSEAGPPPKLAHRPTADKPQQGAHGWDQVQAVQLAAPP